MGEAEEEKKKEEPPKTVPYFSLVRSIDFQTELFSATEFYDFVVPLCKW